MGSHHGIAPDKVYTADGVTIVPGSSYLTFSPLLRFPGAVIFCCTVSEVTFGGRYPLSFPVGARTFLRHRLSFDARDRSECLHNKEEKRLNFKRSVIDFQL